MSLRSHPVNPTPDHPDPVTRNQYDTEKIQKDDPAGNGTNDAQGRYPVDALQSAEAKSTPPQHGLIDQTTSGVNLKGELNDAKQGRDQGVVQDEFSIENGPEKDV